MASVLRLRWQASGRLAGHVYERALDVLERMLGREWHLRVSLGVVTPLGWTVAGLGVLTWLAGWRLGWRELMIVAAACVVLLVLAGLFVLRPSALRIAVAFEPPRVVAGDPSAGQVTVTNATSRRSATARVELPVGAGMAVFDVGPLGPGAAAEEVFVVPTGRRGVIPVGPATSVRGTLSVCSHEPRPAARPTS